MPLIISGQFLHWIASHCIALAFVTSKYTSTQFECLYTDLQKSIIFTKNLYNSYTTLTSFTTQLLCSQISYSEQLYLNTVYTIKNKNKNKLKNTTQLKYYTNSNIFLLFKSIYLSKKVEEVLSTSSSLLKKCLGQGFSNCGARLL